MTKEERIKIIESKETTKIVKDNNLLMDWLYSYGRNGKYYTFSKRRIVDLNN